MWIRLAQFILNHRLFLIAILILFTAFMGYKGKETKWSYEFMKIVPEDDPEMIYFNKFRETFGEDGNILAIGIKDHALYKIKNFQKFYTFCQNLKKIEGVHSVIGLPTLTYITANRKDKKFETQLLFNEQPKTQSELDSILLLLKDLKVYEKRIINADNKATLLIITINAEALNSAKRLNLMQSITDFGEEFNNQTDIRPKYAGLPYVRTIMAGKIRNEMQLFLFISLAATALVLFLFFRSFSPVFYSIVIIVMVVIWVLGTLAILDYKITILTGLLPPILVVIGIPNSIYLINKYHQEYNKVGNKAEALIMVIKKIGVVVMITNATTAVGFLVLAFTNIAPLQEFGIVASINIVGTFVLSIIIIPVVFSYLPPPEERHTKHLKFKILNWILHLFETIIIKHRIVVYIITAVVVIVSIVGAIKVKAITYLVDDLPEASNIKQDLAFFEENFEGIMPLEIIVDTRRKKGYRNRKNLQKIAELEEFLTQLPNVSIPISYVTVAKTTNQAYFNNNPDEYHLPGKREQGYIARYLKNQDDSPNLIGQLIDSTGQLIRLSMKVADLGSHRLNTMVIDKINAKVNEIFKGTKLTAKVTGTTLLFIKGNQYLIDNLRNSMLLAFLLIAVIMGILFGNLKMIIISLIPNMIPLLMTTGLMGFLEVPLKPSTALVFSIAFGISVDDSIHFLAKFRQELFTHDNDALQAIITSLKETGTSMIYTSIVLFFGFVIFVASEFGGTVALGALTSATLLIAMITNLLLLPSLLYTFHISKKSIKLQSVFGVIDVHYDEDEEIDLNLIKVPTEKTSKES